MEYKNNYEGLNNDTNVLEGIVSLEKGLFLETENSNIANTKISFSVTINIRGVL